MKRVAVLISCVASIAVAAVEPCRVKVVDDENGWPVPLVFLITTHGQVYVTDNAGVAAIDSPELMGRETWFTVKSHGYGRKKDGFGNAGFRFVPRPGGEHEVKVTRWQIAKRLGRVGGAGLFAESQKCGLHLDARESGEFGRDSVQTALYRGRVFWLWGDTNMQNYPLGIFNVTAATTPAPAFARPVPPVDPQYRGFTNEKGRLRGVIKRQGGGPIWIFGLVTLTDAKGRAHLCGAWSQIKEFCTPEKNGLCEWDDASESFTIVKTVWTRSQERPKAPRIPDGMVCRHRDANGKKWLLFGNPFPFLRIPDSYEAYLDESKWGKVEKPKTIRARDGSEVTPAAGHMAWSGYRKKYVAIVQQKFGKPSAFGEVWYVESASPYGPWENAVKVVTHDNYTFYNPVIHTEGCDPNSSVLLFGDVEIEGVTVVGESKGLSFWLSDDGEEWRKVGERGMGNGERRVDLRKDSPSAKFVKVGFEPGVGKKSLSLKKILVYGKKLY